MDIQIGVDKIKIGLVFESYEEEEYEQARLWAYSIREQCFGKPGKVWKPHKLCSVTHADQPLDGGGNLFTSFGFQGKKYRVWYEFNPSKACHAELAGHFAVLLDYGFRSLVLRGMVTRCEFAIDVDGAQFHDYAYVDTRLRAGETTFCTRGTEYLGSELSARSFKCYDKRKEQQERHGLHLDVERLRLEVQLQGHRKFPMIAMAEIANPFLTLLVVEKKRLMTTKVPVLAPFKHALQSNAGSMQLLFASLPKSGRKAARHALQSLRPEWWVPEVIWEGLPSSLGWIGEIVGDAYVAQS